MPPEPVGPPPHGLPGRPPVPPAASIACLAAAAADCRACDIWQRASRTVFGVGPDRAAVALVGEQPGDREDRTGFPFVGPSGRLLDRAVAAAGIPREQAYVTNVVKHFRFTERWDTPSDAWWALYEDGPRPICDLLDLFASAGLLVRPARTA